MSESFPRAWSSLLSARGYAEHPDRVSLIETHISWVLLAGRFAFKIKRPVRLAFIDQSSLARREWLCREELRLNRRFAPELYLGVVPITFQHGEARIGGEGAAIEYAVCMRRFDASQQLDWLLAHGGIQPNELAAFGRRLAQLHARLPAAGCGNPWGHGDAQRELVLRNFDETCAAAAALGGPDELEGLRPSLMAKLDATRRCLEIRRSEQRVRECHGDLHARNIARIDGRLTPFDCLEFADALRWIDVADEVALLLVDLESRGCALHAYAYWSAWLEVSGDYGSLRVLDLYKAHRALVRAKVAALNLHGGLSEPEQRTLRKEHQALIAAAGRALSVRSGWLVMLSGLSGSGKSWLAQRLAPALGLVHLRSDLERKRLAGPDSLGHSGSDPGRGLYAPATTAAVYDHLALSTEAILGGGYGVIVDATFLRFEQRQRFAAIGAQFGAGSLLLLCHSEPEVLRQRLLRRQREATDPSEADARVLEWQLRQREPISPNEHPRPIEIDTQRADAVGFALAQLRHSGLTASPPAAS